jgi:hypothetical protein
VREDKKFSNVVLEGVRDHEKTVIFAGYIYIDDHLCGLGTRCHVLLQAWRGKQLG